MGISGSDKALMVARSGVARSGATRSDYFLPNVLVTIGGTDRSSAILKASLEIDDVANATPSTAGFTVRSDAFTPTKGQEIIIGLGSTAAANRIFAGRIIETRYAPNRRSLRPRWALACVDYTFDLDDDKFSKTYTSMTATAIAQDIVSNYTTGFTYAGVAAGLATIDEITFTDVFPSEALTRIANRIGGLWHVDYNKDVHLYLSETSQPPQALTDSNVSFWDLEYAEDLSQIRTRVYGQGGGGECRDNGFGFGTSVGAGTATLPVTECGWYSATGGMIRSGVQVMAYTGRSATEGIGNLTGVTTTGHGGGTYLVEIGARIDLWVQRDDTTAQTALAAITGRSGVRATSIVDGRLGLAELTERADAELALGIAALQTLSYTSRDRFVQSGKELDVDLTDVVTATLKVQRVRIYGFRGVNKYPLRRAECSNVRTPAELTDLLRAVSALTQQQSS